VTRQTTVPDSRAALAKGATGRSARRFTQPFPTPNPSFPAGRAMTVHRNSSEVLALTVPGGPKRERSVLVRRLDLVDVNVRRDLLGGQLIGQATSPFLSSAARHLFA
jgi:hypothetical protein